MEPTDAVTQDAPIEENEEEEDWDEEGDYEDDAEAEAEAEAIARRLGEELLAGIVKAQADQAALAAASASVVANVAHAFDTGLAPATLSGKLEAAVQTVTNILNIIDGDGFAKSVFTTTVLPEAGGANVFDLLKQIVNSKSIARDIAGVLSQIMLTLASSEALFGGGSGGGDQEQIDSSKRKRGDEGDAEDAHRPLKRTFYPPTTAASDFQAQMLEAIGTVTQALSTHPPSNPIDSAFVTSIQLQLHQLFLFAMTSAPMGGPYIHALQEIGGLCQVLGVLSGIQIGPPAEASNPSWLSSSHLSPADINTAVYPCLIPGCQKTFSRLFTLRSHQRVHATHRPFRCPHCPASFVRNHDLKRHRKLHDKKGFRCSGCGKSFSRRDAIKRHKNNSRGKEGMGSPCFEGDIEEVEVDDQDGEDSREERRAKIWSGISEQVNATARAALGFPTLADGDLEEGEMPHSVIAHVQTAMMGLHVLLQAHVTATFDPQLNPATPSIAPADPTGQATLASVIARAQSNLPTLALPADVIMADATSATEPTLGDSAAPTVTADDAPSLSMIGLSAEQALLLEQAIANAALAAQAQAEAEAALEEEEEDYDDQEGEGEYDDMEQVPETVVENS